MPDLPGKGLVLGARTLLGKGKGLGSGARMLPDLPAPRAASCQWAQARAGPHPSPSGVCGGWFQ